MRKKPLEEGRWAENVCVYIMIHVYIYHKYKIAKEYQFSLCYCVNHCWQAVLNPQTKKLQIHEVLYVGTHN